MLKDRPSRTLLRTAIRRATHQRLDYPVILDDPIALRVVPEASDPEVIVAIQKDGAPDAALLRSLFAMRSRFAEDRLADAAARGVRQYVIVGAGLDTFPWRQPAYARTLRLFSADHPASLAFTQARIDACGLAKPPNLTDVPVDLEQRDLGERLGGHGFDFAQPGFFSMLGVVQYLTAGAAAEVLKLASSLRTGSEIVFSFALPDDELNGDDREAAALSVRFTASMGEPWRCRLRPRDLVTQLGRLGFRQVFHLTPALAQERYFANRHDHLRAPGWEQLIAAIV
jgi:methyltransferase (TIGR00027 family)